MKLLFAPNRGTIVLEKEENKSKIYLDDSTKLAMDLGKTAYWKIVASHEANDYKVGDNIFLGPSAKNNIGHCKLPTTEGVGEFLITNEDHVVGKLIENVNS